MVKVEPVGDKVLGCCLGIFDLAGGNGPPEYVGNGGVPPLLWVIRGQNGTQSWDL